MTAGPKRLTYQGDGMPERQRLAGDAITLQRAANVLKRRLKDGFWAKLLIRLLEHAADKMRRSAEEGRPWPR